ncbi:MAG: ferrochelatase [Gemmatimonadota bacterium]|nr:ferrochelatase [Gemmatimonadota bacterium]
MSEATRSAQPIGVLLMAYGGPDSTSDIPGYLADIRDGRPTTPGVLTEITRNYQAIGGSSPIARLTQLQVDGIEKHLNPAGETPLFRVYVGMRHWSPWIEDTVGRMASEGITRSVSMVLAPHYSGMSIARYQAKIASGLDMYHGSIEFAHIDSYHTAPGLIESLADRVRAGIARWPEAERDDVHVIFSAHSLPERIVKAGDPYDAQVHETARLIADNAGISDERWSWSYQSAGRSPEPWLGPTYPEHLAALAERGIRNVVAVPVGFVCDHVEILYDIDVDAQNIARSLDMRLERPPSLNDDPRFLEQLASIIVDRAVAAGWA